MPRSERRCHRVEGVVSEAPSQSSPTGRNNRLEARIVLEHDPPLNLMYKLAGILNDTIVCKSRVPTASDRTLDCRPGWEGPDIPKGAKSQN